MNTIILVLSLIVNLFLCVKVISLMSKHNRYVSLVDAKLNEAMEWVEAHYTEIEKAELAVKLAFHQGVTLSGKKYKQLMGLDGEDKITKALRAIREKGVDWTMLEKDYNDSVPQLAASTISSDYEEYTQGIQEHEDYPEYDYDEQYEPDYASWIQ